MTDRDKARLADVHPALVEALEEVLVEMESWGDPMMVVQGLRTLAEQEALYASGRTRPGPILTMNDGVKHPSNHQAHADGFGHAVDCCFATGDPYALTHKWENYGEALEKRGLTWGGRWSHPHDAPHAELPETAPITTGS